jgi:hypothetical protein
MSSRTRSPIALGLGAVVCSMMPACLLYTDAINSAPTVSRIDVPAGPFDHGEAITVQAVASDPDQDPLQYSWWVTAGPCPQPLVPAPPATTSVATQPTFIFMLPDGSPSACVWVIVTDPHGATASDAVTVSTEDLPPRAVIDVQRPMLNALGRYDLYSTFQLSSAGSNDSDGDTIATRDWTLVGAPPQSSATLQDCPGSTTPGLVICFDALFPGDYTVDLTVSDPQGMTATLEKRLTVDTDHRPCVGTTTPDQAASPIVAAPSEARTFEVDQVLDDGAPFPLQGAPHVAPVFSWSLQVNGGGFAPVAGLGSLASLELPADSFVSGDQIDVQVTISDAVTHGAQDICEPGCASDCPATVTWTVEYR